MPPASSKKRSATMVSRVGTAPSAARASPHVGDDLLGALGRQPAFARRSQRRSPPRRAAARDLFARGRADRAATARACAPAPRRARTGSSAARAGVLDAHAAGLDAADAPRVVAEQEDVAAHALDREVLVDLADERAGRLLDDVVVGGVGNGAAARDRGEARAAPRRARGRARGRSGGAPTRRPRRVATPSASISSDRRRTSARVEVAIRIGAAHQREELVGADLAGRGGRDASAAPGCRAAPARDARAVELARADRAHRGRASARARRA